MMFDGRLPPPPLKLIAPLAATALLALVAIFGIGYVAGRKAAQPQAESVAADVITGQVVRVTDGDTLVVLDSATEREVKVRLAGIDAPEKGQDYGWAARKTVIERYIGRTVTVRPEGRDRYGRTIGVVFAEDEEINRWLVEAGWAWHYTEYSDSAELAAAEQAARQAKRGLWAGANPVPPWEWRAARRDEGTADREQ